MKPVLPKASRGFVFNRLFSIEMNDFDVERLLPSLFYVVVTRGRGRGGRINDPKGLSKYVDALATHPRMSGFDDPIGRRLLQRWVRSSVVRMGRVGRARKEEQIEYVLPLTFLAYKTGFPAEIRRQRNVHLFLYRILLQLLYEVDAKPSAQAALSGIFSEAFGKGVTITGAPKYDGSYDGVSAVDLHTLLSLNFLDGFEAAEASKKEADLSFGPALPAVARKLGRDLLQYVLAYREFVPVTALTRQLMALINFELFIYTMKLIYGTNSLVANGELPGAMSEESPVSPPELFVDFTRDRGSTSDQVARACVNRDLEELRNFYESAMWLRTMDRFVELNPQLKSRVDKLETPQYLQALTRLSDDQGIQARAQAEIESIRVATLDAATSEMQREEAQLLLDEVQRQSHGDSLSIAVRLLAIAQRKSAVEGSVSWYWSAGGLRKPFGLLVGNLTGRRNWRYAMSDDLLAALVQLSFTEDASGNFRNVTVRPTVRLSDFLAFIDSRFGLLIDRPPAFLDEAGTRAAGKENLEALKGRLRQMGFFTALSDDFTAQHLRSPWDAMAAP